MNKVNSMNRLTRIPDQLVALWKDHRYTGIVFLCCLSQLTCIMAMKSTISLFVVEVGGSTLLAGILSTLIVLSAMVIKPVVGTLLDKHGPHKLFLVVTILVILAVLGHQVTLSIESVVFLVVSVMLVGLAHSSLSITEVPLFIKQATAKHQEVYMINLVGFNTVMATAIAPTLSQSVLNRHGFHTLYVCLICISVAGLCVFRIIARHLRGSFSEQLKESHYKQHSSANSVIKLFQKRIYSFLFIANLTWGMSNGTLLTFLIPFGKTIGINNMGLFFGLYSGVNIALRWIVPLFINRIGRRRVLLVSFVCLTISTLLLARIENVGTMILPAILAGIGTSSIYTPIVSSALDVIPTECQMKGLGLFLASFEIGQGLASFIIGISSQYMTYPQMFTIIGFFQLFGLICVYFCVPKRIGH